MQSIDPDKLERELIARLSAIAPIAVLYPVDYMSWLLEDWDLDVELDEALDRAICQYVEDVQDTVIQQTHVPWPTRTGQVGVGAIALPALLTPPSKGTIEVGFTDDEGLVLALTPIQLESLLSPPSDQ